MRAFGVYWPCLGERAEAARVQRQLSDAESSYQRNDVGQTVPPHISSNGASAPDAAVAQTNAPQRDATQQAMAAGAPDYGAHAARIAELETKLQADFVRIVEASLPASTAALFLPYYAVLVCVGGKDQQ